MRVLLIPFEIALLLARMPLDLRHRRLAELLALSACVPLLHHVCLRQPNTQRFMIQGMAVATTPGALRSERAQRLFACRAHAVCQLSAIFAEP